MIYLCDKYKTMNICILEEKIDKLSSLEDILDLFEYIDDYFHKEEYDDDSTTNRKEITIKRKKIRSLILSIEDAETRDNMCFFYDNRVDYAKHKTESFYDMLLIKCCSYIEFDHRYKMTMEYLLKKIVYLTDMQKYELLIQLLQNEKRKSVISYFFTRHNIFYHSSRDMIQRAISHSYYLTVDKRINRRHAQVVQYLMNEQGYIPIDKIQKDKIDNILADMKKMEAWK